MRFQKTRILDGVALDGLKRFGSVGHARRIAQIDEMLCGQTLMQRAIDGQAADAAVKDSDGQVVIQWAGNKEMMVEAQGIEP